MSSVLTSVKARSPALWHSTLTWYWLLQASINELEVVVDESNVQMSSLREQLDAAQQRLDMAEADVTALQATETNLQQQLRSTQVGYYLTDGLAQIRSQCCISLLLCFNLDLHVKMRKTDCFGETRLVPHIPSSS